MKIATILIIPSLFLSFSLGLDAQNITYCNHDEKSKELVLEKKEITGKVSYHNILGKEIIYNAVYKLSLEEREKKGYTSIIQNKSKSKTGSTTPTLTITYLDVVNQTGVGFDDPNNGATRKATIEKAVEYYANLLDESGTADIEIQESEFISGYALAWGGQYYFSTPGFQDGTMFKHLTSGTDPSSTLPDGVVTFNFTYSYNEDYNTTASSDEYDLYTIALHELGHAFGFTSMSSSDGSSQLASGCYSSYDQFLQNDDSESLFTTTGGGSNAAFLNTSSSDLISDEVVFELDNVEYGYVYSPSSFNSSSLDHFDSERLTSGAYLMHPSLATGIMVHEMHEHEAWVFSTIGYNINWDNFATDIIEDASILEEINLFPNPITNKGSLTLDIHDIEDFHTLEISIFDVLGNQLYSYNNSNNSRILEIPTANLATGTYSLVITTDKTKNMKSFVIY